MRNNRWASKDVAKAYIKAYEKRVDTVVTINGEKRIIPGPKGLSYWAACDYLSHKG